VTVAKDKDARYFGEKTFFRNKFPYELLSHPKVEQH
jgi:hypothetical protein